MSIDLSLHSPLVTIIIPTYNSSGTLKLSLESVLLQDLTDFEVLVVGDGCTDDSEEVVSLLGDARVHWINLPENSGTPSQPRNAGLLRARGRFIAYLGHDDLWFPWHLSELVHHIERSGSDFVFSLGAIIGPEGIVGSFTIPKRDSYPKGDLSPSNWLHGKHVTDVIGHWSQDAVWGDDRDFLKRVWCANLQLDLRRQLSVLKYPSALWEMYSMKANFPQSKHLEAIHRDAQAFRLEILLDLATATARQTIRLHHYNGRMPVPLIQVIFWLMDIYGRNRWPLNKLLYWRWRRRSGLRNKSKAKC